MKTDPPETILKIRLSRSRQLREFLWLLFIMVLLALGIGAFFMADYAVRAGR
jgi:uncharacterized membrane protein